MVKYYCITIVTVNFCKKQLFTAMLYIYRYYHFLILFVKSSRIYTLYSNSEFKSTLNFKNLSNFTHDRHIVL